MRIECRLKLKNSIIPLDYRRLIISFLKASIEKENKELFLKLYEGGNAVSKPFTFYVNLSKPIFKEDSILLAGDEMGLVLSTNDFAFGLDMYNGLLRMRNKEYPLENQNGMTLQRVRIYNTSQITQNEILIHTRSPLVVRKHEKGEKDKYFLYNDEGFAETFQKCIENQLKSMNISWEELPEIKVVNAKRVVVKTLGLCIPGSLGLFRLKGEAKILDVLYQSGLGSRKSQGFGSFELYGR